MRKTLTSLMLIAALALAACGRPVDPATIGTATLIESIDTVPNTRNVPKIPSEKPKSPTRLTTNAFIAAALALGL